ncbi:hypothetical protein KOY_05377 [Bacillus cereus VDM021]|uniref:TcpD family membrane protein n=1 Tax=Bacillus TaxID=1386 RepID=UPI00032EB302|nr:MULTISPECIES: TcpD family membrane protein [Bacillus]EOQ01327.1 hypothetical protein KOY_05377 [Bacillus cereus VDM021]MCX2829132.1 TcpD family membrane protein [Bacillus sp. DHT2]MDR4919009.1 TcpD family membrane protein [Bacillus pseudomycoides]
MLDMMNHLVLGMGLQGVFDEIKEQGTYALYIVFIIGGIFLAVKRAWTIFASLVIGGAAMVFFINKPDALKAIGTFLGGLVGL